jgi:hypothetical protein
MGQAPPPSPTLLVRCQVDLGALVVPIVGLEVVTLAADRLDLVDSFAELVDGHRKILNRHLVPVRLVAPSALKSRPDHRRSSCRHARAVKRGLG